MRKLFLAAAAAFFAAMTAPIAPASAGGCCHDDRGYDDDDYSYSYSSTYRYPAPPRVVYKHYLPDEDDFHPRPKHHGYVPWYVGWEYSRRPLYRYRESYTHYSGYRDYRDDDGDCSWLKRRAKHTDSRYWWKRYHNCVN